MQNAVKYGNIEVTLKDTDQFILDVEDVNQIPYITRDEFITWCNLTADTDGELTDELLNFIGEITSKYSKQYSWDSPFSGIQLVRDGYILPTRVGCTKFKLDAWYNDCDVSAEAKSTLADY